MGKKILLKTSEEYFNFYLKNDPEKLVAVHKDEYTKILQLKDEYFNKIIPDKFTVKAFQLGKIGTNEEKYDIYSITDQNPFNCKVNNLIECAIERI